MKKAKIFLSAIAVVGVVGGALAFTAHKANQQPIYTDCVDNTLNDDNNTITVAVTPEGGVLTTGTTTTLIGAQCFQFQTVAD